MFYIYLDRRGYFLAYFIFSVVLLIVGLALYIAGKNLVVSCKYVTISFAFMLVYLIIFLNV